MGTRSLTIIKNDDEKGKDLLTIYRQFDGYPGGHGQDLKDFLMSRRLVNGYQGTEEEVNGMGDLAAQLLCHLKWTNNGLSDKKTFARINGPYVGNVYVYPNGSKHVGEEYTYIIKRDGVTDGFRLTVYQNMATTTKLYDGPVAGFNPEMEY